MSKQEGQSVAHNSNVKCGGENCPVCFWNTQTAWIRQHRLGRILTILDAGITDEKQKKALKDLITQECWRWDEKYESMVTEKMRDGKYFIQQLADYIKVKPIKKVHDRLI